MSAMTDDDGRYRVESWSKSSQMGPVTGLHTIIVPYKAGYEYARQPSQERGTEYLARATGTESDRAAFLLRVTGNSRCYTKEKSEKSRLPLLKALEQEGATLKAASESQHVVETIGFEREMVELGYEEGQQRHLERASKEAK